MEAIVLFAVLALVIALIRAAHDKDRDGPWPWWASLWPAYAAFMVLFLVWQGCQARR